MNNKKRLLENQEKTEETIEEEQYQLQNVSFAPKENEYLNEYSRSEDEDTP